MSSDSGSSRPTVTPQLRDLADGDPVAARPKTVPGIGPLCPTTLVATVGHVALMLVGVVAGAAGQPVPGSSLFVATGPAGATAAPVKPAGDPHVAVLRQRLVRIDREVLEAARLGAVETARQPPALRLNLFDGLVLRAVVDDTGPTSAGYHLSGRIEGRDLSSVVLVVNGDVIAGTVRAVSATFTIRTVDRSDNMLVIREIASSGNQRIGNDVLSFAPPGSREAGRGDRVQPITAPTYDGSRSSLARDSAGGPEDGSRIDVLVAYTPAARRESGGKLQIAAEIDLAVAETNRAYADSDVVQRVNLASAQELACRPGSDRWFPRACWERIERLRDQYAADVGVLVPGRDTGCCYAWIAAGPQGAGAEAAHAVAVVRDGGATFAHELGHVSGLRHDRYATREVDGVALTGVKPAFAFGYVNQRMFVAGAPISSRWKTIMAYSSQCLDGTESHWCPGVLRFSNPRLSINGDPTGVPGDRPSSRVDGPADARRMLNRTRRQVANFRRAPCLRDGVRIRLQAGGGQYVVAVANGGGEVLANQPRPGPRSRFTLVDANGGCVEPGDVVSLHTSDGFYLRARRGGGSTVDATAPRATPWAQFVVRRHRGKGPVRSGDLVTLQAHSGHYVWAIRGGGGSVRADRRSPGAWGRFKVTRVR